MDPRDWRGSWIGSPLQGLHIEMQDPLPPGDATWPRIDLRFPEGVRGPGLETAGHIHWPELVVDQRAAVPLIQALNRQADDWRSVEMARARKLLARGTDVDQVLEALSRGLTQKMLHGALAELHATDGAQREELAQTVSRLFLRQASRGPGREGR